jgi:hypothetical protein
MEKNNKEGEDRRSEKSDDENKEVAKIGNTSNTQIKVKPEIVRDIPHDIGRHGSDPEKDLNPEE